MYIDWRNNWATTSEINFVRHTSLSVLVAQIHLAGTTVFYSLGEKKRRERREEIEKQERNRREEGCFSLCSLLSLVLSWAMFSLSASSELKSHLQEQIPATASLTAFHVLLESNMPSMSNSSHHQHQAILAAAQPLFSSSSAVNLSTAVPDRPIGYGAFGVVWWVISLCVSCPWQVSWTIQSLCNVVNSPWLLFMPVSDQTVLS